jgi:hypothetical protein
MRQPKQQAHKIGYIKRSKQKHYPRGYNIIVMLYTYVVYAKIVITHDI